MAWLDHLVQPTLTAWWQLSWRLVCSTVDMVLLWLLLELVLLLMRSRQWLV